MAKKISETPSVEKTQKYSKEAFVDASEGQERLLIQVLLNAEEMYTKEQVAKLMQSWKAKEVK